jgi:surface-anchored protein
MVALGQSERPAWFIGAERLQGTHQGLLFFASNANNSPENWAQKDIKYDTNGLASLMQMRKVSVLGVFLGFARVSAAMSPSRTGGGLSIFCFCSCMCLAAGLTRRVFADVIITNQHTDLTFQWSNQWTAYWDVDDFGEVSLSNSFVRVPLHSISPRPDSTQFDFLGTSVGSPVWTLPQVRDPQLAWLGISTTGGGLVSPVSVRLLDVQGPGNVSLWNASAFLPPSVYWSTSDGLNSSDILNSTANSHSHYNWSFTAPGEYVLTLSVSAGLSGGLTTAPGEFQVRFQAIPEPSTFGLLVFGVPVLVCGRSRRMRR